MFMKGYDVRKYIAEKYTNNVSVGIYKNFDIVYEFNQDARMMSASIIKIFILSYLLENNMIINSIDLDHSKISEDSILKFLKKPLNSEFLMALMISESDNSAANYFIDFIGMNKLNSYFRQNGFKSTHISRHFLDYNAREHGNENFTSVSDIYNLFLHLKNSVFYEKFLDLLYMQKDHSGCSLYFPDSIRMAGKSGLLDDVMSDIIIYSIDTGDYLYIVLTNRMPYRTARKLLTSYCYDIYKNSERF